MDRLALLIGYFVLSGIGWLLALLLLKIIRDLWWSLRVAYMLGEYPEIWDKPFTLYQYLRVVKPVFKDRFNEGKSKGFVTSSDQEWVWNRDTFRLVLRFNRSLSVFDALQYTPKEIESDDEDNCV